MHWGAIASLYAELARVDASPAVALNRAVAVAEVDGPQTALALVDELLATAAGQAFARASHQPHLVRADLLRRLEHPDAADAYRRALAMAPTAPERRHLAARLAALEKPEA